jgi:hypothetical protein
MLRYTATHTRSILYDGDLRKVLQHEATHALLWLAGDPSWGKHDGRFP